MGSSMKHDYRAIEAVVNIWTAEMIAMAWKHDNIYYNGDEAGHDNEHKSDGRRHDHWHGHLHHEPGSPHIHADGTTHSHD
jgi:hypothetical protein